MRATESYQRVVTEKVENGWRIDEETADRVVLVKRNLGSLTVHLLLVVLTFWWAMGLPNLLYGAYKYLADSERTVVSKTAAEDDADGSGATA